MSKKRGDRKNKNFSEKPLYKSIELCYINFSNKNHYYF